METNGGSGLPVAVAELAWQGKTEATHAANCEAAMELWGTRRQDRCRPSKRNANDNFLAKFSKYLV
jgi:hypothetical protein